MDKADIAAALGEIATLLELRGDNPFKIRAYQNAARTLETLDEDLGTLIAEGRLTEVKGIGKDLAQRIVEMRNSGESAFLSELRAATPPGLVAMLEIPGVGPKKVKAMHTELGIDTLEALKQACEDGRVAALKGFGEKTAEKILAGLKNREAYGKRHLRPLALAIALPIVEGLRALPGVANAEAAGSLRRKMETVGDLDFLVAAEGDAVAPVMAWFCAQPGVAEVTARGDTKSSVRFESGLQADLRVVPPAQFHYALHHFTGSKDHNVAMRRRALDRGLSLSEWGLTSVREGVTAPASATSEAELFAALDLPWIAPELREGMGEVELAEAGKLPRLVEYRDIRGVFHNHTKASDGVNTLEEMTAAAQELGWEYWGVADHSKSSFQANGLDETRLRAQIESIRKLNASGKYACRVFAGSEVDILKDGSLDFDDELLAELDYAVASVHNAFTLPEDEMTARIIRAVEHPAVTMLGHLTGRLLLRREPYKVNAAKVIDAAIANGTIIELNAHPLRLDMDWRLWIRAAERGLMTSINPDAHETTGFRDFAYGVDAARKGRLEPRHILNCLPLAEVEKRLKR